MAGGFDAGMRIGEDVDLVWRLVAAGHRVRYDPAHEALHDARPHLRNWMGRKFQYGTGGAELASRHPDNVITAQLSPSMGLAALAFLARCSWSVPIALLGLARAHLALARSLPEISGRSGLALRLSLRGFGWTLRQESALVLRHWWPATLLAATRSRTARRVIVSAIAVDAIAVRIERPGLHPLETFAGRRLDDLAYGAGLWWGALRSRSIRCLELRWVRASTGDRPSRGLHAGRSANLSGRCPRGSPTAAQAPLAPISGIHGTSDPCSDREARERDHEERH
jgi:mycofactocin glycosyltransferase